MRLLPDTNEDFLSDILAGMFVAKQPIRQPKHHWTVAVHDALQRLLVAFGNEVDEFYFVGGIHLRKSYDVLSIHSNDTYPKWKSKKESPNFNK